MSLCLDASVTVGSIMRQSWLASWHNGKVTCSMGVNCPEAFVV